MLLRIQRHLRIQDIRQDLRREVDDCHADPLRFQVLCRLKTDKSASNDHSFLYIVCLRIIPDPLCIIRSPHRKDAREVFSFYWKFCRRCSDSDHQLIVGTDFLLPCCNIFYCDFFSLCIQRHSFLPRPYFHTGQSRIFLGCVHDQFITALDRSAHIVRQPAAGIGDILILCDDSDLRAPVLSLQFCGSLRSGGNSADDQYFHLSTSFLSLFACCQRRFPAPAPQFLSVPATRAPGLFSDGSNAPRSHTPVSSLCRQRHPLRRS